MIYTLMVSLALSLITNTHKKVYAYFTVRPCIGFVKTLVQSILFYKMCSIIASKNKNQLTGDTVLDLKYKIWSPPKVSF